MFDALLCYFGCCLESVERPSVAHFLLNCCVGFQSEKKAFSRNCDFFLLSLCFVISVSVSKSSTDLRVSSRFCVQTAADDSDEGDDERKSDLNGKGFDSKEQEQDTMKKRKFEQAAGSFPVLFNNCIDLCEQTKQHRKRALRFACVCSVDYGSPCVCLCRLSSCLT